jgi:HNH endonuclease
MNAPLSENREVSSRKGRSFRGPYAYKLTDDDYLARLYAKCVITEEGCIRWQGWKNYKGYGEMTYRNKCVFVHRLVYTLKIGPIPPGMFVCHTCDVRDCVNHEHLWLGTTTDNMRDKFAKGRDFHSNQTHCKRGHPFDEVNTYIKKTKTRQGWARMCKTCQRLRQQGKL